MAPETPEKPSEDPRGRRHTLMSLTVSRQRQSKLDGSLQSVAKNADGPASDLTPTNLNPRRGVSFGGIFDTPTRINKKSQAAGDSSDSDSEPVNRGRARNVSLSMRRDSSAPNLLTKRPIIVSSSEEEGVPNPQYKIETPKAQILRKGDHDDEMKVPSMNNGRPDKHRRKRSKQLDDEELRKLSLDDESEASDIIRPPRQRRGLPERRGVSSSFEENEVQTAHRLNKREKKKQELEEELAFLRSSSPIMDPKPGPEKSARKLALERLKRYRAGEQNNLTDDDLELEYPEQEEEIIDEFKAREQGIEISDIATESEEIDESGPGPSYNDIFRPEEDDKDFIDDEQQQENAMPEDLALQLATLGSTKPAVLFKFAVEWIVHKYVNPQFNLEDEFFQRIFTRLDDKVGGLVDSKFTSSVWRRDFIYALRARPDMTILPISVYEESKGCEACGRMSHPATFLISFAGRPYNSRTLNDVPRDEDAPEELAVDSDTDSSEDSQEDIHSGPDKNTRRKDNVSYEESNYPEDNEKEDSNDDSYEASNEESTEDSNEDSNEDLNEHSNEDLADNFEDDKSLDSEGREIPKTTQKWKVGVFCKSNAETAHTLKHWRHHLQTWVKEWMEEKGHLSPSSIQGREGWSEKEKHDFALEIVGTMHEEGIVDSLFDEYRRCVDIASEAKQYPRSRRR